MFIKIYVVLSLGGCQVGNIDTESFGPSFCMGENLELRRIKKDSNEEDESDDDL